MLGTISIQDLKIYCIIGIYPEERIKEQPLLLNIDMDVDIQSAIETQNVDCTINYVEVSTMLENWVQTQKFQLIEKLVSSFYEWWRVSVPIINDICNTYLK